MKNKTIKEIHIYIVNFLGQSQGRWKIVNYLSFSIERLVFNYYFMQCLRKICQKYKFGD